MAEVPSHTSTTVWQSYKYCVFFHLVFGVWILCACFIVFERPRNKTLFPKGYVNSIHLNSLEVPNFYRIDTAEEIAYLYTNSHHENGFVKWRTRGAILRKIYLNLYRFHKQKNLSIVFLTGQNVRFDSWRHSWCQLLTLPILWQEMIHPDLRLLIYCRQLKIWDSNSGAARISNSQTTIFAPFNVSTMSQTRNLHSHHECQVRAEIT